jgi:hypothetical protein
VSNRFRVSSALFRRLEELGFSREAVLRAAGLSPALLEQERILLTTEELFALHRALESASDDPAIGLKLGTEERVERYDPIAIAALYARSFRDALGRMARYKKLSCPEAIHLLERRDECHVRFEWLLAKEAEPALLTDIVFAWVVEIARRGTGGAVHVKQVEFSRPERQRALYEGHFACPAPPRTCSSSAERISSDRS